MSGFFARLFAPLTESEPEAGADDQDDSPLPDDAPTEDESSLPDDAPDDLVAAERVSERTREAFIEALEDEELDGRAAYAAMESLSEWFGENSTAALMTETDDAAGEVADDE